MSTIIDDSAVQQSLKNLEKNLTGNQVRSAFLRASRKGGNLLKKEIREAIIDNGQYEHIHIIKRNVKVVNSKSRTNPGVNIYIKGPDVPVGQGKHRRFWKLTPYALLVFKGNYKSPGRPTKSGKKRGNVKGTNPENLFEVVANTHGSNAIDLVVQHFVPELEKVIAKSMVKNG